jgi:hypothetical protein
LIGEKSPIRRHIIVSTSYLAEETEATASLPQGLKHRFDEETAETTLLLLGFIPRFSLDKAIAATKILPPGLILDD